MHESRKESSFVDKISIVIYAFASIWIAANDSNACGNSTSPGAGGVTAAQGRSGLPARIAFTAIRRGEALRSDEIARRARMTPEAIAEELRLLADAGEANLDEAGRVVAVAGLSVVPAAHQLVLAGVPLYTWCAWDAVGIPAALGVDASVRTQCGWCRDLIEVELRGGRLAGDARERLWLPGPAPGGLEALNPQLAWCPQANLFCTGEHLERWRRAHGDPAGEEVTLIEAIRRGIAHWAAFREPMA
jgi:alkylmercury lyase